MRYEVAYKCDLDFPSDVFYLFPVLTIRYRPIGTIRWKRKKQPIDQLAKNRSYGGYSSTMPLHTYNQSDRTKYFDKVLREKFNDDMDSYVKEVAYVEILNDRQVKKHKTWVESTMNSWLTSKWRRLEVDIPD